MTDDQRAVIAFLSTPEAYGLRTGPVERIDTHISIVLLAGDRVYKLKRAVRFDYVDFSTIELRRISCEAEVRLNRRTAPSLYLGMRPVTCEADGALALGGQGDPVDWVVEMVRFDQDTLSVSNSLSGRHWELDQVPAVGDPTHIIELGPGHRVFAGKGPRRVALQRRVAACRVVVGLEVGELPLKITGIPEQHMVQKLSPHRPNQALHEGVRQGHIGHRLDFVDLQNSKIRRPTVRLEQWIMIGTEMSRCAPTMNGGVEHATEAGAIDGPAMHAETDDAMRELVHDHEHPVAPEHDGLASKEVHAPQAVCGVSDERQPRGSGSARGGAIVCRQHAVHDVLVDVDPERVRDDARNPWTAEPRIARLELDDSLDECLARPLRSGLLRARAQREQLAVLAAHQRLMKRQERRGAQVDGDLSDSSWTEEERPESAEQPVAQRQVRRPPPSTAQDDHSCCLSKRFSAITARTPPGPLSCAVTTAK